MKAQFTDAYMRHSVSMISSQTDKMMATEQNKNKKQEYIDNLKDIQNII